MDKKELQKYVGNKIKEYRVKRKMTQGELGEKIGGIENNTISAYERGVVNLGLNTLFSISQALEIQIDDLFPPMNSETTYKLHNVPEKTDKDLNMTNLHFLQSLMDKISSMDEEEQKRFVDAIKFSVDFYKKMND